jgi:predicted NodU family carbamoyl transferase
MPQLILGVHSGSPDAAAAVFEDYSLKAAVHLERLTMCTRSRSSTRRAVTRRSQIRPLAKEIVAFAALFWVL